MRDDFNKKAINVNDWSVGVVALYLGAEIVSEMDYGDSGRFYIFRGTLRKGIRNALDSYYPDGWIMCSNMNPDFDYTEKHQLVEFCESFGVIINERNKDLLTNMEWSEMCRILKEAFFTKKVYMEKSDNIFKFYESMLENRQTKIASLLNLKLPSKVIEAMLLTFIRKSREWENIHTNSKRYKLLLKDFKDKNPMIDQVMIQYAMKSAKMSVEDRLLWLMINLQ